MKKILFASVVLVSAAFFAFTLPQTNWAYDSSHAKVGFSITHMMVSDVEGYFKSATASLTTTKADFSDAVVEMTAQVSSINTDSEKRDGHLQTDEFFDAAKYPTVTFKSTSFKKSKTANVYVVKGNLTMHGITKPVILTAVARTATHPMTKKTVAGFKVTGKVNRLDFGIGAGMPTAVISNEVLINANAEFVKE